ncbi:hypothetical protein BaRGS_00040575, partial [Batillaria attramentaria]
RFKCKRLLMKRSDYVIEVPMNYYLFEETSQKPLQDLKRVGHAANRTARQSTSQLKGKELAHQDKTSPEHSRLETKFRNDTDKTQTYSFKFEKTRTATLHVTYQRGFSIGGKANFSIGLPAALEGEVRYEVTKATGETFEESLTTCASSDIRVSRHSKCTASVVLEERHLLARFELDVTMSMPEGEALVFIKNKDGKVVFVKQIFTLVPLFPQYRITKPDGTEEDKAVRFKVKGVVEGTQLSTHHIRLKSRKLKPGAKEGTGTEVSRVEVDDSGDEDSEMSEDDRPL